MTDIQKAELTIALNCARDILVRCEENLGTKPSDLGRRVKHEIDAMLGCLEEATGLIRRGHK